MDQKDIHNNRTRHRGRPDTPDIQKPAPGQESVWDYPRPPAIEEISAAGLVVFDAITVARSTQLIKVMETASPPTYYFPPEDVSMTHFQKSETPTYCEWKGRATYYDFIYESTCHKDAAWAYHEPLRDATDFKPLAGYMAFYPGIFRCFLDDRQVDAQNSRFYGGWITPGILGPFKGPEGTLGW